MSKYKRSLYMNIDTGRWDATRPQKSNTPKTEEPSKLSLKSVVDWLRAFFSDPLE